MKERKYIYGRLSESLSKSISGAIEQNVPLVWNSNYLILRGFSRKFLTGPLVKARVGSNGPTGFLGEIVVRRLVR